MTHEEVKTQAKQDWWEAVRPQAEQLWGRWFLDPPQTDEEIQQWFEWYVQYGMGREG